MIIGTLLSGNWDYLLNEKGVNMNGKIKFFLAAFLAIGSFTASQAFQKDGFSVTSPSEQNMINLLENAKSYWETDEGRKVASNYYCAAGNGAIGNYADRIRGFSDEEIGNRHVVSIYDRSTDERVLTLTVIGSCDEVECWIGNFVIGSQPEVLSPQNMMNLPGVTALVKHNR